MRIAVYNPCIERIGGSIATILAFADTFKELGHTVHVYTTKEERKQNISSISATLKHYKCKYLEESDFYFDDRKAVPMDKVAKYDFIFCRGLYRGCFPVKREKYILWVIYDGDLKDAKITTETEWELWTNSRTTRNKLNQWNCKIVPAPHDYSLFRKYALPYHKRDIDFINIGRATSFQGKGLKIYSQIVKMNDLNSMLISSYRNRKELAQLEELNIPMAVNINKQKIAEYLGRSKYFLFTSYNESCSLSIYEAMNAGCIPIVRDVPAARKQLGGIGYIYNHDVRIIDAIQEAVSTPNNLDKIRAQGKKFDRENIKNIIKQRLKEVYERNNKVK